MKERLTDAAIELMWENSYGSTSVDAICERAGAKKGSFYYFFKSKSELTAAALEADWAKKRADMDAIFSPTVPPIERFERYFDATHDILAERQEHCHSRLPDARDRQRDLHARPARPWDDRPDSRQEDELLRLGDQGCARARSD
jgi:AcrR family transcriptional regulator